MEGHWKKKVDHGRRCKAVVLVGTFFRATLQDDTESSKSTNLPVILYMRDVVEEIGLWVLNITQNTEISVKC